MPEKVDVQDGDLQKAVDYEMHVKDYRAYRLVYFVLGVIEVLLILRFFFKLLAANPQNAFVSLVYGITNMLMLPFNTIFRPTAAATETVARVFEPASIVAMIVYALLAAGISKLLFIMRTKPKNTVKE